MTRRSLSVKEDGLTIALDHEPQYFFAGDPIKGRLIVNSTKGVNTKGISMTVQGRVRTEITGNEHGESRSHWEDETILDISKDLLSGTHELPPGIKIFPFSVHLPHDIPSSMELSPQFGMNGRIEYSVNARLERSWAIDWTQEKVIPVKGLLDLQQYPKLHQSEEFRKEKQLGCLCCAKPLRVWCNLEKTGYYPGEEIQFEIRLENGSSKEVKALKAELSQNFTFCAHKHERLDSHPVAEVTTPMSGEDFWQGELLVPPCDPSGLGVLDANFHRLINLRYSFDVIADVSGCCSSKPKLSCDVTIGSLPPPPPLNR